MTHDEMIAVILAHKEGKKIECMTTDGGNWMDAGPDWNFQACIYRVKPDPKTVPMTVEDFDGMPVVWITRKCWDEKESHIVRCFMKDRIKWGMGSDILEVTFNDAANEFANQYFWSTDRKNWKPFTKEVQ